MKNNNETDGVFKQFKSFVFSCSLDHLTDVIFSFFSAAIVFPPNVVARVAIFSMNVFSRSGCWFLFLVMTLFLHLALKTNSTAPTYILISLAFLSWQNLKKTFENTLVKHCSHITLPAACMRDSTKFLTLFRMFCNEIRNLFNYFHSYCTQTYVALIIL